jgi:SRSO17 transposase
VLGLTRLPPWFEQAFEQFTSVFSDSRNVTSFTSFTSAVILSHSKWTVDGLSQGISRSDAKSPRTYRYFLGEANWNATDLAHRQAEFFFDELDVGSDDEILFHVDDTFAGKTGDATDGVAELYNSATGELEQGNKFVTSCLQVGDVYIPYLARMYIKDELASNFQQPFKKKTQIAVDDIITPLQLPAGAALTVVFDSAYYGGKRVAAIQDQGHDVVCRYKSSNHVSPVDKIWTQRVDDYASTLEYESTTITVRGEQKTYDVASEVVEVDGVGQVKIVASKTADDTTRYYLSTDLDRSAAEILSLVEDRWNIETLHQQSNEKFGFKQYELRRKQAIERYIQIVFLAWTLVTLSEQADVAFWDDRGRLSVRLDHAQEAYLVETVLEIYEEVDPSLPRAERREIVQERVRQYSWSSIAISFIPAVKIIDLLNELHGSDSDVVIGSI